MEFVFISVVVDPPALIGVRSAAACVRPPQQGHPEAGESPSLPLQKQTPVLPQPLQLPR